MLLGCRQHQALHRPTAPHGGCLVLQVLHGQGLMRHSRTPTPASHLVRPRLEGHLAQEGQRGRHHPRRALRQGVHVRRGVRGAALHVQADGGQRAAGRGVAPLPAHAHQARSRQRAAGLGTAGCGRVRGRHQVVVPVQVRAEHGVQLSQDLLECGPVARARVQAAAAQALEHQRRVHRKLAKVAVVVVAALRLLHPRRGAPVRLPHEHTKAVDVAHLGVAHAAHGHLRRMVEA
mmetsp:Transcript_14272/g.35272  ORF Transcript_14272/g.35272 Transcript_14272/m.35272 type:complete len:233 (+) Transcript_14272:1676-2374(+)